MKDLKDQLIKKLEELIAFYGKNISDYAVFLSIHHMGANDEDIETGKRLRSEISALKKQMQVDINTPFFGNSGAKYDETYLQECIAKAKPNLSKIKDVDKALDEIRGGYDLQGKESAHAYDNAAKEYHGEFANDMYEQILKIIMKHITRTKYGRLICKSLMAKEIADHLFKFAEWCTNNTVRLYNRDEKYLILGTENVQAKSIEDLYSYYLTNIFNDK